MKTVLFTIFIVSALASAYKTQTFLRGSNTSSLSQASSCTPAGWHATNVQIAVLPDTLSVGQNYTIYTSYDLDEQLVSGSTAKYIGKLDGFTVLNDQYDLCSEILAGSDTPCPLGPGHIDAESTDTVESWVPTGDLELKVTWVDQDGQNVMYIDFVLHII